MSAQSSKKKSTSKASLSKVSTTNISTLKNTANGKNFSWLKTVLTAYILFHLFVIVSVPNDASYINQILAPVFLPYVNAIGFNTQWQFFSPDPGPPIFVEYEVAQINNSHETHYFPPLKFEGFFRDLYNRKTVIPRILAKYPDMSEKMMGPYLCKKNPRATHLVMGITTMTVPHSQEVRDGALYHDFSKKQYKLLGTYFCNQKGSGK